MKFIKDLSANELNEKKIILRVDFNVPLDPKGNIKDDTRIRANLSTIKYLTQMNVDQIVIISHLGRPVVRPKEQMEKIIVGNENLKLEKVAEKLKFWLKTKEKITSGEFKSVSLPYYKLSNKIYLLENIRFDPREDKNDEKFSKELASLGDIFIEDAFAACHRKHASIVGITKYIPSYGGILVKKEIENLDKLISEPEKPFLVVMGGAKVYDKMLVIKNLLKKVDYILLGGVMANTFLAVRGVDVKKSLIEKERLELADEIFRKSPKKFIFPTTLIWDKGRIVDVDPKAIDAWKRYFEKANTIFWNGTMGLTSLGNYKFTQGTKKIANILANSKAKTIVAGGDTIAEVAKYKLEDKMSFISTGGGATLEYLAGEKLPGLEALK